MRRILFPVDYTDQSVAAAPHVAAFAKILGAEVVLLHTVAPPDCLPASSDLYTASVAEIARLQKKNDREKLEGYLVETFPKAVRVLGSGDPANDIVHYAHSEEVDLIMLPTHGIGPFRRFLIGSITAKVLHESNIPVWTSEHSDRQKEPPEQFRKILCACDLSARSIEPLRWAASFAASAGAVMEVVHAVPASESRPLRYFDTEIVAAVGHDARNRITKMLEENGLAAVTVHTRGGSPDKVIREVAEETGADLVVTGRGAVAGGLGRLRSHSYAIIGHSPCPVVSV